MKKQLSIFLFLTMALGFTLVACGGGDDDGGDPVAVVKDLFKAIEDEKFDTIPDLACAAQKEEVATSFDFGAMIGSSFGAEDVDPQLVLDAMSFKFSDPEYKEVSKSGDKAVVHAKGRLEISVDPDKFKVLVRELLAGQGLEDVPDDMIDQAMGPALEQFENFGEDIDEDFELIKEDGKWLICEE
jgi:hypothetical protein